MVARAARRIKQREKLYYSITEVGELTELKPHILRYWETEFPFLRPKRNRAGNRAYRKKDIEMIKLIKKLLYEDGYTIEGAKNKIRQMRKRVHEAEGKETMVEKKVDAKKLLELMKTVRDELVEISKLLR